MKGGFYISASKDDKNLIKVSNKPISEDDTDFQGFSISINVSKIKELIRKLGLKPPKLKKAELLEFFIANAQQPDVIAPSKTEPKPVPKTEPKPVPKTEPKPVPKTEPKPVPKTEPKPVQVQKKTSEKILDFYPFSFSVKTKKKLPPDAFNYSRDFNYKTIPTENGFNFIFNNKRDLATGIDMSMFVQDYKNPRLYQWSYEKVPKKLVKTDSVEKIKTPKIVPKKIEKTLGIPEIVEEWDEPFITNVIDQSSYNGFLDKIDELINKGKRVSPANLFFGKYEELLKELYKKYSIQKIDEVLVEIINQRGGDPIVGEYRMYIKRLPAKEKKKLYEKT